MAADVPFTSSIVYGGEMKTSSMTTIFSPFHRVGSVLSSALKMVWHAGEGRVMRYKKRRKSVHVISGTCILIIIIIQ